MIERASSAAVSTSPLGRQSVGYSQADLRPHVISLGNNGALRCEGRFACTQDDVRNIVRQDMRAITAGWKKKRVYPDFLVALEELAGKPSRLVVVETKGLHLQNDDTAYKRRLFEILEKHSSKGVSVGELTLGDKPDSMRFRLVLEGDWKSQVDSALASAEA